jgi:uncharacterized protein with NAD-binding domain and iron-sulfur cluster
VVGAGVAGLTAAHELAERGFDVTVYERRPVAGGKARSIPVPGSGTEGRWDLPGEHGFRFFGGFYRHVIDSMKRIPDPAGGTVAGNLVETTQAEFARCDNRPIVLPDRFPQSLDGLKDCRGFIDIASLRIPPTDFAFFATRLLMLLSSCDERRYGQWENVDWWTFVDADNRSSAYQTFLADGMTRRFVAAQARELSARTCGYILIQLMQEFAPGQHMDRVLDGPTSEVWIDPWVAELQRLGVRMEFSHDLNGINCESGRISSVAIKSAEGVESITADYYVLATPVEITAALATDAMKAADPVLGELSALRTRWMNGIQFYLKQDLPMIRGHVIYADSPFSLTSISQRQFWQDIDFRQLGDGTTQGILSVDISDWTTPGLIYGKPAMELTAEQIKEEVVEQIKRHVGTDAEDFDDRVQRWFLDPDICWPNPTQTTNLEPLLINTVGSWYRRPEANCKIENLFMASDYVRTFTDLATMEGANEAGRRAANGILDAADSDAPRCEVWPFHEPMAFRPAKALDRLRYRDHRGVELPTADT